MNKKNNFTYIAELCQNHLGKTKNVEKMLAQCALHGATTVKLQYIYAKNLSFRPRFENGIFIKNKKHSIKRPYGNEYKRLKNKTPLPFGQHARGAEEEEGPAAVQTRLWLSRPRTLSKERPQRRQVLASASPSLFFLARSARARTSSRAHSSWPCQAARSRAVLPLLSCICCFFFAASCALRSAITFFSWQI